jgi:hypothetical protein
VELAKQDGSYSQSIATIRAASVVVESEKVIYQEPGSQAPTKLSAVLLDRGVSFEAAKSLLADAKAAQAEQRGEASDGGWVRSDSESSESEAEFEPKQRQAKPQREMRGSKAEAKQPADAGTGKEVQKRQDEKPGSSKREQVDMSESVEVSGKKNNKQRADAAGGSGFYISRRPAFGRYNLLSLQCPNWLLHFLIMFLICISHCLFACFSESTARCG